MDSNIFNTFANLILTTNAADSYLVYFIVGIAPCILWLLFYVFKIAILNLKKK